MSRLKLLGLVIILSAACLLVAELASRSISTAYAQQQVSQSQPENNAVVQAASDATVFKAQSKLVLVDSVVTDKKGNYIRDLTGKNFRIWEDNKEQVVKSFSYEGENQASNQTTRHFMVLFFDNSTLSFSEQNRARMAAAKFIDANAGPDRLIASVEYSGAVRVTQDFTANTARLKKVVAGISSPDVTPTLKELPTPNVSPLTAVSGNFGARNFLLAVRDLSKSLMMVPGRKSLVLLTAGFPLPTRGQLDQDLLDAINACNRANVAIYPIDVRGLVDLAANSASGAHVKSLGSTEAGHSKAGHLTVATLNYDGKGDSPHLLFVQHSPAPSTPPHGPPPAPKTTQTPQNNRPVVIPPISPSVTTNQEVLYALAQGTGGFLIHDTNDLLPGMQRIAQEQTEYYLLGYTPPDSADGSCHVLKVKVDRSGTVARSRSGYCKLKPVDLLAGKPAERELENHAMGSQANSANGSLEAPFFFVSPNVARVNLAMETPSANIKFTREKGKFRSDINVLGIVQKPDNSEAARFSDTVHLNLEKNELEGFQKKPFQYENQFDIASGAYKLIVVFSSGTENFGRLQIPLAIDSYDGQYLGLSDLALSKELHPITHVAERLDADLMDGHSPLVFHVTEVVPAADHHFSRSEPFTVYLEIYEPLLKKPNPPKVGLTMKIIDIKTGLAKFDENITETDGSIQFGNPAVPMALKVPIDKLEPGSYRLELRALDSTGNRTAARAKEFVVD